MPYVIVIISNMALFWGLYNAVTGNSACVWGIYCMCCWRTKHTHRWVDLPRFHTQRFPIQCLTVFLYVIWSSDFRMSFPEWLRNVMLGKKWLWTLKGRSLENGKKCCECSPFLIRQLRPITWTAHNIYSVYRNRAKTTELCSNNPKFFFSGKWDISQNMCHCLGNSRHLILYWWASMVLQRRRLISVSTEIFEYLCFSNVMWGIWNKLSKIVLLSLDIGVKLKKPDVPLHVHQVSPFDLHWFRSLLTDFNPAVIRLSRTITENTWKCISVHSEEFTNSFTTVLRNGVRSV
jgi:hypothetical protein